MGDVRATVGGRREAGGGRRGPGRSTNPRFVVVGDGPSAGLEAPDCELVCFHLERGDKFREWVAGEAMDP